MSRAADLQTDVLAAAEKARDDMRKDLAAARGGLARARRLSRERRAMRDNSEEYADSLATEIESKDEVQAALEAENRALEAEADRLVASITRLEEERAAVRAQTVEMRRQTNALRLAAALGGHGLEA